MAQYYGLELLRIAVSEDRKERVLFKFLTNKQKISLIEHNTMTAFFSNDIIPYLPYTITYYLATRFGITDVRDFIKNQMNFQCLSICINFRMDIGYPLMDFWDDIREKNNYDIRALLANIIFLKISNPVMLSCGCPEGTTDLRHSCCFREIEWIVNAKSSADKILFQDLVFIINYLKLYATTDIQRAVLKRLFSCMTYKCPCGINHK